MIVGIGCDIVEHSTTSKLGWLEDSDILMRIFSKKEIELAPEKEAEKYFSSRFAIKEAVLKCLGTGMQDGISLKNIVTKKEETGRIILSLSGKVKQIAQSKSINKWHLTLSHSTSYSIAVVVAEN